MKNDDQAVLAEENTGNKNTNPLVKAVTVKLGKIKGGQLSVTLPNGSMLYLGDPKGDIRVRIKLNSYKPISKFLMGGDLGWAESYMDGEWESPDVTDLCTLALLNEDLFSLSNVGSWVIRNLNRLRHRLNTNSKRGSKRNIEFHYDLGNEFYKHWLGETMAYSSGLFDGDISLEDAQVKKNHRLAEMMQLQANDKVLEIGCGWGGFSKMAAQEYKAATHGLTISDEQLAYAHELYEREGISELATASLTDYRDEKGSYDKIVSVEMLENVGYEHWPSYFKTIKQRLKPGGIAVVQVIVIEDHRFEHYRNNVDFIQRYIFPGGLLPSVDTLKTAVEKQGLTVEEVELTGDSYAKTCKVWQNNFQNAWPKIKPLGFDDRFKRMWEYYLSYCEAGFRTGAINVGRFKIVHK